MSRKMDYQLLELNDPSDTATVPYWANEHIDLAEVMDILIAALDQGKTEIGSDFYLILSQNKDRILAILADAYDLDMLEGYIRTALGRGILIGTLAILLKQEMIDEADAAAEEEEG